MYRALPLVLLPVFQLIPSDTFGEGGGGGEEDSTSAKNWKQCTNEAHTLPRSCTEKNVIFREE